MQRVKNLATDKKVSEKSFPDICEKPFATILALNLIRLPYPSLFSQKTILLPMAFLPLGKLSTTSKTPNFCN